MYTPVQESAPLYEEEHLHNLQWSFGSTRGKLAELEYFLLENGNTFLDMICCALRQRLSQVESFSRDCRQDRAARNVSVNRPTRFQQSPRGVCMCGNDFYIERHPKLDPFATTTAGVYIVGSCQAPKDIPDSVAQANAAAARILATIIKGSAEVEVTTAEVNEELCCGCQTCVNVCPYTAIVYDADKNVSVVNEILCKGCGTCGSACPNGAIKSHHFTDQQILSQIEGLMQMSFELEEEIL